MMTEIEKPAVGQPCNGCGLCCQIQVCLNGAFALGLVRKLGETVPGPCPALTPKDGKLMCGVILNPKKYLKKSKYPAKVLSKHFANLVGAGNFCDELGYSEDPEEIKKLDDMYDRLVNDPDFLASKKISIKVIHE